MHRALLLLLLTPAVAAQNSPASGDSPEVVCGPSEAWSELVGGVAHLQARAVYPEAARRDSVEGRVVVRAVVSERGEVERVETLRSPDARLSEAALDAVRASQFVTRGLQGRRPVKTCVVLPITFRLGDAASEYGCDLIDCVPTTPELIGGLEGLQARLLYPEAARRDRVEGQVVIQFVVTEAGEAEDLVVVRSPDDRLSEAALDAVYASRFVPALYHGAVVRERFAVPIAFRLGDG